MRLSAPLLILAAILAAGAGGTAVYAAGAGDPRAFQRLEADWYRDNFQAHPLLADRAGFHDWDDRLDQVGEAAEQAETARLHRWLDRFQSVDPAGLTLKERGDREVVIARIRSMLLEEERIQFWRRNPDDYASLVTEGLFALVKRDYAPLDRRLRFAIARAGRVPDILATAKATIRNPPKVYVDIALENLDGSIRFFETGLPAAFARVRDAALQKQFAKANAQAIAALEDYRAWLQQIEPAASGDFAFGAETYRLKLAYDEMLDLPLDRLLEVGYANLEKDQAALEDAAHRVDPGKTVDEVVAALELDHPAADRLVSTAHDQLTALRSFIAARDLTPLPRETMPSVRPTPEFERALIEAAMDAPGAYDRRAAEAFYYVTPPAADLTPERREAYLRGFNIPVLNNIAVHEVFPGHFVQLMLMRSLPGLSMVRRLAWTDSNVEGWAHYCEAMTLDEGFGDGDSRLRVGQLLDALLRDARYIVAIEMHTRGMTLEQATDFFVKEAHQTRPIAEKEVKRGTEDATYLYYTLGKLEILKLREDWKAKMGPRYDIGLFHRKLLEGGTVPLKVIRREMMGEDGPLL